MKVIIGDFTSKEYIEELNIPKGKSKTYSIDSYFTIPDSYSAPYSAEVIVYFGDMYSYKELKFVPRKTSTVTLNVNGILE